MGMFCFKEVGGLSSEDFPIDTFFCSIPMSGGPMQAHLRIRPPHLLPIPPSKNTRKIDRETEREIETDRDIDREREKG